MLECVKSSPSQPNEFSFLGRQGRFFYPVLAFFSLPTASGPRRTRQKREIPALFLLSFLFRRQGRPTIPAKGRIFDHLLTFFSFRPPGTADDSDERENFRPSSCFLLSSAARDSRRFRRKGEFLHVFLLSSLFRRRETAAMPVKGRISACFLAFFSLPPPQTRGASGKTENFCMLSCFLLSSASRRRRWLREKREIPNKYAEKSPPPGVHCPGRGDFPRISDRFSPCPY